MPLAGKTVTFSIGADQATGVTGRQRRRDRDRAAVVAARHATCSRPASPGTRRFGPSGASSTFPVNQAGTSLTIAGPVERTGRDAERRHGAAEVRDDAAPVQDRLVRPDRAVDRDGRRRYEPRRRRRPSATRRASAASTRSRPASRSRVPAGIRVPRSTHLRGSLRHPLSRLAVRLHEPSRRQSRDLHDGRRRGRSGPPHEQRRDRHGGLVLARRSTIVFASTRTGDGDIYR